MCNKPKPMQQALSAAFDSQAEKANASVIGSGALSNYPQKVTVKGLVEMPEWKGVFTESAVRGLIDKSRARYSSRGVIPGNGLIEAGAVIRLGRKILIDVNKFRAWVESHRVNQAEQK